MKNIRLKIKNDGSVHVSADPSVSLVKIEDFLLSKIDWILENKEKYKLPFTPTLGNKSVLKIFGETFTLNIVGSDKAYLKAEEEKMTVGIPDINNITVAETLIVGEIVERGRKVFEKYFREYLGKSGYKGIPPRLTIQLLKSRWGHYSSKKHEIMINISVAGLPVKFTRYLIAHEISHLFIKGHGKDFYAFGEKLLPGFKNDDRELNQEKIGLWNNVIC